MLMNLSVKNIDKKISKVSNIFAKSIIPLSGDHTDSSHIVASKKNNFSTILQRFCNNFAAIFDGFFGGFRQYCGDFRRYCGDFQQYFGDYLEF